MSVHGHLWPRVVARRTHACVHVWKYARAARGSMCMHAGARAHACACMQERMVGLEEEVEEEAEEEVEGEVAASVDQPSPQDQPDGSFPQGSPPVRRFSSGGSVICSTEPLAPATSAACFLPEARASRGSSPGGMPFPSTLPSLPSTPQSTLCTLPAG